MVCSGLFRRIERILVAFDGSKYSLKALEYACDLAEFFKSIVRVVMVIDTARIHVLLYDVMISREEEVKERANKIVLKAIDEVKTKHPSLEIEYVIRRGHPAEEIMEEINEWKPDLLVIGAKGATDLKEIQLGGIAETLIKVVETPILVIK